MTSFNKVHGNVSLPYILFGRQEVQSITAKEPPLLGTLIKGLQREMKDIKSSIVGYEKHLTLTEQKVGLKRAPAANKADKKVTGGAARPPAKASVSRGMDRLGGGQAGGGGKVSVAAEKHAKKSS
jgi:hypothetical protein